MRRSTSSQRNTLICQCSFLDRLPACRVCFSSQLEYVDSRSGELLEVFPGGWHLLRCLSCGFCSVDPLPDVATLREAYRRDYYSHVDFETASPGWFKRIKTIVFKGYYSP